ncbi:MAG: sigma-70 family RNA polymerase sigma factor [Oscillospiraceae bacterium]|jgi:RNA polymerase sporulation-specific sigma factor
MTGTPATNTAELLRQAQSGDKEAAERLIIENTGLIWSVARRFFGRGIEPDDLFQLGSLGFLKAVQGFEPSFGTQFSTYAVPKIAGEIRRFLRDDGSVKVSRSLKEQAQAIRNARSRLMQKLGTEPTLSEIAEETGLSPEEIAVAETAAAPTQSLQYESGEDGFTLESVLSEGSIEDKIVERVALREAMARLSERERLTIDLRYFRGLTQEQCARIIGVSQVQISRLEKRTLEKLREII